MRIDRFLVSQNIGTRKEVQKLIRQGKVTVNGERVTAPETGIDPDKDQAAVDGTRIDYMKYVYIIMNKPKGYISASNDKNAKTVIDLLPDNLRRRNIFPAGRLDKDTTGMLIVTDDGNFAHKMLSPKNHVDKEYFVRLDGDVTSGMVENFRSGIEFYDGTVCLSAKLLPGPPNSKSANVTVREGKYHQVKKMFQTQGLTVLELKRIRMGGLYLPEDIKEGQCRLMSQQEKQKIFCK